MTWGEVLEAAIAACMANGPNADVEPAELAMLVAQIRGTFRQPDVYSAKLRTAGMEEKQ